MDPDAYMNLLQNAVYSKTKAIELRSTIEYLGQNWFSLKEQIKNIRLKNIPEVKSKMLARDLRANEQMRKAQDPTAKGLGYDESAVTEFLPEKYKEQPKDIDALVKLLPYYDVDFTLPAKENQTSRTVRQLLQISRSDAEMFSKHRSITNLHQLMNKYFEKLLLPDQ